MSTRFHRATRMLQRLLSTLEDAASWRFDFDRRLSRELPSFDPKLEAVYLRRGVLLIHIPKNAGTSVERALYGDYSVKHRTWRELARDYPEAWRSCTKIAVLREPTERFLSAYRYLKSGGRNPIDAAVSRQLIGRASASRTARRLVKDPRLGAYFHFRRQSDYVLDERGELVIDRVIHFDHLWDDLSEFEVVPRHDNATPAEPAQRLSSEATRALKRFYAADFELWERMKADRRRDP